MARNRRHVLVVGALPLALALSATACGNEAQTDLKVERLPDVTPNLPQVPTLPPPPYPVKYDDGSYSVYGVRKKIRDTIDDRVEVTGYIVEIYQPPECEEDERCQVTAPHMWIAGAREEADRGKRLQVVGYAENHEQLQEAIDQAAKGKYEPPPAESGLLPIPTDFQVGNKVKVDGMFVHVSGSGFMSADGVLEYRNHKTLEAVGGDDS